MATTAATIMIIMMVAGAVDGSRTQQGMTTTIFVGRGIPRAASSPVSHRSLVALLSGQNHGGGSASRFSGVCSFAPAVRRRKFENMVQ